MRKRKTTIVIIPVALLLMLVLFANTWMVFTQMRQQTRDSGIYQLESISGQLMETIYDAENLTMQTGIACGEYLQDRDGIEEFIIDQKQEMIEENIGVFNVYVAGTGWAIIPDFDMPSDYIATERDWYTGAIFSRGRTYVTSPYQDAMTGDICYTVSVMLGDGDTVLAMDYTMDNIQEHISRMYEPGYGSAVIVTGDGIIAGCSDPSLIGESLVEVLPEYAGIWNVSRNSDDVASARIRSDFLYENLFATRSGNGWYLIVTESDWQMYSKAYVQMGIMIALAVAIFIVVIILYLMAVHSGKRAEEALESKEEFLNRITGELKAPLDVILKTSDRDGSDEATPSDTDMARIHSAGVKLSEMMGQIISYSSIVRSDRSGSAGSAATDSIRISRRFRSIILILLIVVIIVGLYTNISATYRWGDEQVKSDARDYTYKLAEWINTQKSILDMFTSIISTHPEMLDDYEGTIDYLDRITMQFPEISVSYMSHPDLEPSVYMNNGWKPEEGWILEERPWYKATEESADGWSISAPYYDDQTGGYCVTFSKRVYNATTGEFLGIFGIDFFMDELIDILGDSYSENGYAFLVDPMGVIINHPYGNFQMSPNSEVSVSSLSYSEITPDDGRTGLIRDYDGSLKILTAITNPESGFAVYVVSRVWTVFGRVFIYALVCIVLFLICIILIYRMLTDLINWQEATNRQMRDAADAAIAAGQAKSRFLAQMSHEIRTPINAILGMNEMILNESGDSDILDYSSDIQAAGKTLLALINSILDFSKIEDGKMEIIPVSYESVMLIHNLEKSISERAREKSLELIMDIDESIPSVLYGDDVRITQVIMNLLTNAVKYTEKGSVTLSVKNAERIDDEIMLHFSVKDTGIGIREEDMDKLFTSFERIDEKRNRTIEGTGLGISIVDRLLDMMGSRLQVRSVYGSGSEFYFDLKQRVIDEKPMGDYQSIMIHAEPKSEARRRLQAPTASILVVDDNRMNLKVAANLMKLHGIVPDMADSGHEALEKIRKTGYDIVFLDHMMPEMDGIETLQKIREQKLLPQETAVIALTANAVSGAREMYLQAGFDDFLSKPIEVDKLEEKLKKYLPQKAYEEAEEVMEFAPSHSSGEDQVDTGRILEQLRGKGLEVETGLKYCAGDEQLFIEMTEDFIKALPEVSAKLDECLKTEAWGDYRILIHALKSNARTIGADEISTAAKELEDAAKEQNGSFIRSGHGACMESYAKLADELSSILGITI